MPSPFPASPHPFLLANGLVSCRTEPIGFASVLPDVPSPSCLPLSFPLPCRGSDPALHWTLTPDTMVQCSLEISGERGLDSDCLVPIRTPLLTGKPWASDPNLPNVQNGHHRYTYPEALIWGFNGTLHIRCLAGNWYIWNIHYCWGYERFPNSTHQKRSWFLLPNHRTISSVEFSPWSASSPCAVSQKLKSSVILTHQSLSLDALQCLSDLSTASPFPQALNRFRIRHDFSWT